jgi:pimeloyl-ACP methyl ester carboxylesterase
MLFSKSLLALASLLAVVSASGIDDTIVRNRLPWKRLPATPRLPEPSRGKYANINGIKLWYNIYGVPHSGRAPVILIHGGGGNSNYWGDLIPILARDNQVITVDSRGQGRSEWGHVPMSYDLMTDDYFKLLKFLKVKKAAFFGWSDGGQISINMASKHPEVVDRVFAFAAHYRFDKIVDLSQQQSETFNAYFTRVGLEYPLLNPHPEDQAAFFASLTDMTNTQPTWGAEQFQPIDGKRVWYVAADHDEGVLPENAPTMFNWTMNSGYGVAPQVSHFAFLQNLPEMSSMLSNFLDIDFDSY